MFLVACEEDEERQNINILRLVVDTLGLVFGPVIGALIYSITTSFMSQTLASFSLAALLCVALCFIEDNYLVQEDAARSRLEHITYCRLLRIPRALLGVIGAFVLVFTLQYFESVMSYIFEKEHHLDKTQIGYIFCLVPVGVFVAIYPSMLLAKHMTKRFVLMMTLLTVVIVQISFTPSEFLFPKPAKDSWVGSLEARLVIVTILGGLSLLEIVRFPLEAIEGAMIELSCEDEAQHKETEDRVADHVSGLDGFAKSLGIAIAPILSTRLYSRYGLSECCDFAALLHFALFVVYLVFGDGIEVLKNPWTNTKKESAPRLDLDDEEERQKLISSSRQ